MTLLLSIMHQGLIFSLVAMAVFMTSRVINKDDLSVEGSFGFGGALSAVLINSGCSPWIAILAAFVAGAFIGSLTGFLYTRLKMNHLLAGLVTTTACFSMSLALASANMNIPYEATIFANQGLSELAAESLVLLVLVPAFALLVKAILRSEIGLLLRAAGDNPDLLVHFGKSKSFYQTLGFALANALTAAAGSLFVQWSGFFSITGNIGTLITGLASLMIAELVIARFSWAIIIASMIYQSVFATILWLGIVPVWNNLAKASIIILLVAISQISAKKTA
jgi:putative tryptophan/tyrosine transport system permease protein